MTPKEEAIELVNKFRIYTNGTDEETDRFSPAVEKKNAKQCALITVDSILKVAFYNTDNLYEHYMQVKQEITKL